MERFFKFLTQYIDESDTKIAYSHIGISNLHAYQISSTSFSLLDIP